MLVKSDDHRRVNAAFLKKFKLFRPGGNQVKRPDIRMQNHLGVRIKGNHQRLLPRFLRFRRELAADMLVAQMHTVKIADGDERSPVILSYGFNAFKNNHVLSRRLCLQVLQHSILSIKFKSF